MAEVTYRLATVYDAEALATLRAAFLAEVDGPGTADAGKGGAGDLVLTTALRRYFRRALPAGEFIAYVAESEGTIIATSGMVYYSGPPSPKNLEGRSAYIMNMYTLPTRRGRGIATHLLRRVIDHARTHGCSRVSLHTMEKARGLYQRLGFQATDSEMRLDLKP